MVKNNYLKLVKWFCRKLTLNELASAVLIILDVLNGKRTDISVKPEPKPPHYRKFTIDTIEPLQKQPEKRSFLNWQEVIKQHSINTGKTIKPIRHREKKKLPPQGCTCNHCKAPARYLYINNGKHRSQVRCKICGNVSQTNNVRIESKARYWCPHCNYALFKWKESDIATFFKCPNDKCPHYLKNKSKLTSQEHQMRSDGNTSQFKLRYQFKEYHFQLEDLAVTRPENGPKVDLGRIHNNYHVVGLVLSFTINLGLSARTTREALEKIFGISISHQTVINYVEAAAHRLHGYVDQNCPKPSAQTAADETYIIVEGKWHYTWFLINADSRAISGYNLSDNRGVKPALALLNKSYGDPKKLKDDIFKLIADGNPSYDSAVTAYNQMIPKNELKRIKVIGLENHDEESKEYRSFKQMIERLNRTYKFHTRPRAGFKSLSGAVCLTVLFVAFYNFMRPHLTLKKQTPVKLDCLTGLDLYPDMWSKLLQAA